MTKIKIEIDLDDLIQTNKSPDIQPELRHLPTVPAEYNNEWMDQDKVWYKTYTKGEYRWVRTEGRGFDPTTCKDIIIRMSPGNTDVLLDEMIGYHPEYGEITYDDYPENMYIQSERLRQLERLGYEEGEDNFVTFID